MTKKEIWAADCETDPFEFGIVPEPFIWGARQLYTGEYEEFEDTNEFLHFITQRDAIVYAHNGGKFDWQFITKDIPPYTSLKIINSRFAKFKIGEAEFRDSFNILPIPLAEFRKTDFDYEKLHKDVRHKHMQEIKSYLYDDCKDLGELVEAFIDRHGVQLTQASAAMKKWQKMSGRKADKTTSTYFETFSKFYYGGRVQCFEKGIIEDEVTGIDINSAYPFGMKSRHPTGTKYELDDELPDNDKDIQKSFVYLMAESTGAFPFRQENGSLSFPDDGKIRKFYVTGWEYIAARDTGTLKNAKIIEVITFSFTVDFVDYVNELYNEKATHKKNGDRAQELLAKFDLNALYGKFGADANKYKDYMTVPWEDVAAAHEVDGWELSGKIPTMAVMEKPLTENQKRFYNVATAASITGFVRAYLWRSICACEGVIYCDTDCIIARDIKGIELDPYTLGAWDIECKSRFAAIAGKKLYAIRLDDDFKENEKALKKGDKYKIASKGVKLEAKDIIEVAKGGEVEYKNDAPTFRRKGKRPVTFVERTVKMT